MIGHLLVKGMLVYTVGGCKDRPFTHFGAVCIQDGDEYQKERAAIFGSRIVEKMLELFQ